MRALRNAGSSRLPLAMVTSKHCRMVGAQHGSPVSIWSRRAPPNKSSRLRAGMSASSTSRPGLPCDFSWTRCAAREPSEPGCEVLDVCCGSGVGLANPGGRRRAAAAEADDPDAAPATAAAARRLHRLDTRLLQGSLLGVLLVLLLRGARPQTRKRRSRDVAPAGCGGVAGWLLGPGAHLLLPLAMLSR